jgi:hypothetical protein
MGSESHTISYGEPQKTPRVPEGALNSTAQSVWHMLVLSKYLLSK